jgi:hypothetical protein
VVVVQVVVVVVVVVVLVLAADVLQDVVVQVAFGVGVQIEKRFESLRLSLIESVLALDERRDSQQLVFLGRALLADVVHAVVKRVAPCCDDLHQSHSEYTHLGLQ